MSNTYSIEDVLACHGAEARANWALSMGTDVDMALACRAEEHENAHSNIYNLLLQDQRGRCELRTEELMLELKQACVALEREKGEKAEFEKAISEIEREGERRIEAEKVEGKEKLEQALEKWKDEKRNLEKTLEQKKREGEDERQELRKQNDGLEKRIQMLGGELECLKEENEKLREDLSEKERMLDPGKTGTVRMKN